MVWWASAVSGALGLVAIVIGALFNARLNRKRDDRMKEQERAAIAAAVAADLVALSTALVERTGFIRAWTDASVQDYSVDALAARAAMPDSIVVAKLGDKIGLLDAADAYEVVHLWHGIELVRGLVATSLIELKEGKLKPKLLADRAGHARELESACAKLARKLTGEAMGSERPPVEVSAEKLQEMIARRPGAAAP